MPAPKLPEHLRRNARVKTAREWRSRKRREWAAVMRALSAYEQGCAFCPEYPAYNELRERSHAIKRSLRGRTWVAWK